MERVPCPNLPPILPRSEARDLEEQTEILPSSSELIRPLLLSLNKGDFRPEGEACCRVETLRESSILSGVKDAF